MVHVELNEEERSVLAEFLERDIDNMHSEIVHTDDRDYKDRLKQQREVLKDVLQKLQG